MTQLVTGILIILFLVVAFLLFRVQLLAGVLSGSDKEKESSTNSLMGIMLLGVTLITIIAMFYFGNKYWDEMNLPVASVHGEEIEFYFWVTMGFCIAAFVITNLLLVFFAYKYSYKKERKARFYPHNNTLELIWTVVPAIVLSILVFTGWQTWSTVMDKAPADAVKLEIRGEQFKWQVRYPGKDNEFGEVDYKRIDPSNEFGMLCEDPASMDDFFAKEIHIPVNQPVLFKIRARDVLHSVFAPHFRLKMDAVPGMPTKFWFTPNKTTKQMQQETGNPDFRYEIACTEICGVGHFNMKKIIVVETQEEYEKWLSEQVPFFEKNPEVCNPNAVLEIKENSTTTADTVVSDSIVEDINASEEIEVSSIEVVE